MRAHILQLTASLLYGGANGYRTCTQANQRRVHTSTWIQMVAEAVPVFTSESTAQTAPSSAHRVPDTAHPAYYVCQEAFLQARCQASCTEWRPAYVLPRACMYTATTLPGLSRSASAAHNLTQIASSIHVLDSAPLTYSYLECWGIDASPMARITVDPSAHEGR